MVSSVSKPAARAAQLPLRLAAAAVAGGGAAAHSPASSSASRPASATVPRVMPGAGRACEQRTLGGERRPRWAGRCAAGRRCSQALSPARISDQACQLGGRCWAACTAVGQRRSFVVCGALTGSERFQMTRAAIVFNRAGRRLWAATAASRLLRPVERRGSTLARSRCHMAAA